jgi:3-oxoacyl-(acyl-carrier-protein) synthase
VNNSAVIAGYGVYLPFAKDNAELIEKLRLGEGVNTTPWFKSDAQAKKCGFSGNKNVATLKQAGDSDMNLIYKLIDAALAQAMLNKHSLAGEHVRVYLTGLGPRVDGIDYKSFYNKNDVEDILLTRSISNLQIANMSQDSVARNIARHYRLKHMPPNMNCTSNSSLAAVHLGCQGIEKGNLDLVLVINCSKIKSQDIWFLVSQSMLDSELVQPFGEESKSVLFAEGYSVLLLESRRHRRERNLRGGVCLKSTYMQISASRSNESSWLSACMVKVMNQALKNARLAPEDLCAIIPHGNGSAVSDRAEARAICQLLGEQTVPVLAYKGQVGYTATGSGIVDLVIGHYSLRHRELLVPVSNGAIAEGIAEHLLTDKGAIGHRRQHLLKIGIGVDGSVIAMVMSDSDVDE